MPKLEGNKYGEVYTVPKELESLRERRVWAIAKRVKENGKLSMYALSGYSEIIMKLKAHEYVTFHVAGTLRAKDIILGDDQDVVVPDNDPDAPDITMDTCIEFVPGFNLTEQDWAFIDDELRKIPLEDLVTLRATRPEFGEAIDKILRGC